MLSSRRLKIIIIVLIIIAILPIVGILTLHWMINMVQAGNFEPVLNARLLPTAEALLSNPLPQPSFITEIYPSPGIIHDRSGFCVEIAELLFRSEGETEDDNVRHLIPATRLLINGQRLAVSDAKAHFIELSVRLDNGDHSLVYVLCSPVSLPSGIHLFEVQIRNHLLGFIDIGPLSSYQWAYQIP
jgi:hypothetical protein